MADAEEVAQRARLAELQRRLYRRDATPADLEQYTGLRDELAASAPAVRAMPAPAAPTRRRPTLVAGALLGAVALCGAVALLQSRPSASTPVSIPTTGPQSEQAFGPASEPPRDGDRLPPVSARFTDDAAANPVGTTVEVTVDGGRVLAQRFSGSGPAAVPLVTGGAPLDGGLLTVTLTSADPGSVSWLADVGAPQPDPIRTGSPASGRGGTASTTVRYRGAPTPRVIVRAPAGTGWTLVVAFSR